MSDADVAKVITFYDEESEAEMVLLSISPEGKCKCLYESASEVISVRVTRSLHRVRPVNETARRMIGRAVDGLPS